MSAKQPTKSLLEIERLTILPELVKALEDAKQSIRIHHGMGMPPLMEKEAWRIYELHSPEMKRLNNTLSKAKALL